MKKLLYILTLLGFFHTFAQDYNAIDQYLKENTDIKDYPEKGEFESLNLLLSINDCDNCIPAFFSYIDNITDKKPYTVNIITDNTAYAKKALGDAVHFKYNLYYNKDVFSKYLNGRSGIYYKDMSYTVYGKEKDIRTKLKNADERVDHFQHFIANKEIFLVKDSLMTGAPFINVSPLPNNQLLIYDNKVNTALSLQLQPQKDSLLVIQSKYYTPAVLNPKKLYNLPFTGKNLLSFEDTQKELLTDHINFINLYSLNYWDKTYYIVFGVTRMFQNEHNDNISYFPEYFVATQKAESENIQTMLDPSTYDIFYKIDNLQYEDLAGVININIKDKPYLVGNNQLSWRARLHRPGETKMIYLVLATLLLKNGSAQITSINREFEEFTDHNTLFNFKNKNYYLIRDELDEEHNEGFFHLKEFEQSYSNDFMERLRIK